MKRTTIPFEKLYAYMAAMLERGLGYSREAAEITARVLVEADARGHASHGVARIRMYDGELRKGQVAPDGRPEVVHETPISLVIDAHSAPGFPVSDQAMRRTIEKAKQSGTCMTVVRESCHFGMAGWWAEMAADEGLIGCASTNTLRSGIPFFGRERLLGTNPVCISIPIGRRPHFTLDMATSTVAFGKIEVAARRGGVMPLGWAVDIDGENTTDARAIAENNRFDESPYGGQLYLGGATEEQGGYKGYGLALLVELLTAGLSLGKPTYEAYGSTCGICHFFQATRLDLFGKAEDIRAHVAAILDRIRGSVPAKEQSRIYIHGEKEYERREKSLAEGVWLDEATWERLDEYAGSYGMERLIA